MKLNLKTAIILAVIISILIAITIIIIVKKVRHEYSVPIFEYVSKDPLLIKEIGNVIKVSDDDSFETFVFNDTTRCAILWVIGEKADAEIKVYGEKGKIENWNIYSIEILEKRDKK
ncbi:MAG: hypothetical protein K8R54_01350 [Bacteroidales bacterium]|nr:hypothetical protein [Bacteroidales bacterium]